MKHYKPCPVKPSHIYQSFSAGPTPAIKSLCEEWNLNSKANSTVIAEGKHFCLLFSWYSSHSLRVRVGFFIFNSKLLVDFNISSFKHIYWVPSTLQISVSRSFLSKRTYLDKSLGVSGEKGLDFSPAGDDNIYPTVISDEVSAVQG